jgi:hypothetical protein
MAQKDDGYIRFHCKSCGKRLKVRETYEGGNVVPCPKCGAPVTVPLGNLEAIAEGTDMEETGMPGRLNVDPDLLRKRLSGEEDEQRQGPGSIGGPPSLKGGGWSPQAAFGRVRELDSLSAALTQIEQEAMGQLQRAFRNTELSDEEREQQAREAGRNRLQDIRELLSSRLSAIRQQIQTLKARGSGSPGDRAELERLQRARRAVQLYARYILRADASG